MVVAALILSGCSKSEPRPFQYPTYPEQENVNPAFDIESGRDNVSRYLSETVIEARETDEDNAKIFEINKPVNNQIFIAEVTYKSSSASTFYSLDEYGIINEVLGTLSSPGIYLYIVDAYGDNSKYFKTVGEGSWDLTIKPLSSLEAFSKDSINGNGDGVFLNLDKTATRVEFSSSDSNALVRSYGYENRVIPLSVGLGINNIKTALPGNASVILVKTKGDWEFNKVKEEKSDEAK